MYTVPDEVREKMRNLLEMSWVRKQGLNSGIYIGRAAPSILFVPKQPIYKIGQTSNLPERQKVLRGLKIYPENTFFIETDAHLPFVEGLLHGIFSDVRALDFAASEREWFYLSDFDIEWLHTFEALGSKDINKGIERLRAELLQDGYGKTNAKRWLRLWY